MVPRVGVVVVVDEDDGEDAALATIKNTHTIQQLLQRKKIQFSTPHFSSVASKFSRFSFEEILRMVPAHQQHDKTTKDI